MRNSELFELATQSGIIDEFHGFYPSMKAFAKLVIEKEREECAKLAETPVGEYEVVVACGSEPTPHRIPRYLDSHSIATAIRARGAA